MAKLQVMTLDNLTLYDELIKGYIDAADAKSLKTATLEGNVLKLYRVSEPVGETAPAYEIELPETDVSGLLAKLSTTNIGNVVVTKADGTIEDGGVALADLATDTELTAVSDVANANKTAIEKLNGDATTEGSVAKIVKDAVDAVDAKIGTIANLETTAKTDLVVAINEVRNSVSAGGTQAAVTMTTDNTTEGMLKSYTIKQGENTVGVIDIPKDLVVTSGTVEVDPEGQTAGTYIKLVIANQTDPLYINVGTLVDLYTAEESATQIQVAVDNSTRKISAVIVDGSVDSDALATNSVTTVKIADANVTLAKLATDVTDILTQVGTNKTNIESLQTLVGDGYEAISTDAINALFPTT